MTAYASGGDLEGWTIAFDLDGTLVETAPDLIGTLNRMLAARDLPIVPMAAAQHLIGHGALALIEALGLTRHFGSICGPDRVSARKPHGAHIREAVLQAGGDPARAIMVGDGAPDTAAARDAGTPCVVVTFGYTEIAPEALGGDVLIDHFEALEGAIEGLIAAGAAGTGSAI